jgi:hypothetical protein
MQTQHRTNGFSSEVEEPRFRSRHPLGTGRAAWSITVAACVALLNASEPTATSRNGVKSGQCGCSAWSIRQGGGSRLSLIADALKCHDADIVVLSEYRGGPSAPRLCAALHALGYPHARRLSHRLAATVCSSPPDSPFADTAPSTWDPYRMVTVDFATFRLIGIYMPKPARENPLLGSAIATLSSQSAKRALAIGDFNTCRA